MTTVQEALRRGKERLSASGSSTPLLDAQLLLGHATGRSRTELLVRPEFTPDPVLLTRFDVLIERRAAGEPVAYVTGKRDFMEFTLQVGPGVLVPRPETELLVEWARDFLSRAGDITGRVVVDVGTGSGAIAVGLGCHAAARDAILVGADHAPDALRWASLNRQNHGLSRRLHLVQGDLLSWFGHKALLVVANLPYLRPDQIAGNWELTAEPVHALEGGEGGLALIERLVSDLPRVLASDGAVALEIDPSQAAAVDAMLAQHLAPLHREVHKDLAGHDRFITAAHRSLLGETAA